MSVLSDLVNELTGGGSSERGYGKAMARTGDFESRLGSDVGGGILHALAGLGQGVADTGGFLSRVLNAGIGTPIYHAPGTTPSADQRATAYGGQDMPDYRATAAKTSAAKKTDKAKTKAAVPATQTETFDLSQATNAAASPLVAALTAALGLPAAGQGAGAGGAPSTAQYAAAADPGLSQYMAALNQGLGQMGATPQAGGGGNLAAVLQGGLGQMGQADAAMPGAISTAAGDLGQSTLLQDLLNAARYQAIYKQAGFGQPPASGQPGYNPALSQLYGTVVAGGNALSGGLPGAVTKPTSGTGAINPGTSPF